mgnify:FL=1
MVRRNNRLVNNHFRKDWQTRVRCWFDQPARKTRRRSARADKAKAIFPRPVAGLLRPLVHGQTVRYNSKIRFGRGFTIEELKKAQIKVHDAPLMGIAVDYRRRNTSLEGLNANVQRLELYRSKLVMFPRKAGKPKKGDASAEEQGAAIQQKVQMPFKVVTRKDKARAITDEDKARTVYLTMRSLRGVPPKKVEKKD